MFYGVAFTNTGLCKYFRNAVLPTEPALEAVLTGSAAVEMRPCAVCGVTFPADGKKGYCSDACAGEANIYAANRQHDLPRGCSFQHDKQGDNERQNHSPREK